MPGPDPDRLSGGGPGTSVPPLVLRCRTAWRLGIGGLAAAFLALATVCLAAGGPEGPLGAAVLFVAGALTTSFFLRYCLAALELSDRGFRLRGPLYAAVEIGWSEVHAWRRRGPPFGPGLLRVQPRGRRRVTIPLLYEDAHLLELGLHQGGFPAW